MRIFAHSCRRHRPARPATPTAGFVRCIRISPLRGAEPSRLSAPEWQRAAHELQTTLASQSAMNLPYEVLVQQAKL